MNDTLANPMSNHTTLSPSEASCLLATQILTPTLRAIVAGEMFVAALALAPNLLLLSAVWDLTIFPSNLRLLLGHFCCILIYFSLGTLIKGAYLLITPPCAFQISMRRCKIMELCAGLHLPNMYYALVALCVERVYATWMYRSYDKNQRRPWMAMVLIAGAWTTAFTLNRGYEAAWLPDDQYVPYCDTNFLPPGTQLMFPVYAVVESMSTAITLLIYFYNRHILRNMVINRALYNLSARFLVDQNVQINRILLPSMALHVVCHLPAFGFLIPLGFATPTRAWVLRCTFLWRLMYAVLDPCIAFTANAHLRQHLFRGPFGRVLRKLFDWDPDAMMAREKEDKEAQARNSYTQAIAHFDYLERAWAVARPGGMSTAAAALAAGIQYQTEVLTIPITRSALKQQQQKMEEDGGTDGRSSVVTIRVVKTDCLV